MRVAERLPGQRERVETARAHLDVDTDLRFPREREQRDGACMRDVEPRD